MTGTGPCPGPWRRSGVSLVALCTWSLFGPTSAVPAQASAPTHQNVLLIVADDVGVDRVAVYGESPTAGPTTALDLLAQYGVMFRNTYANPVCSPSRATLLTGRYGSQTGVGGNVQWGGSDPWELRTTETTLPHLLAETHRTAAVGKWHLGSDVGGSYMHPMRLGFEYFTGSKNQLGGITSPPEAYYTWEKNVASQAGSVQFDQVAYSTTDHVDDTLAIIDVVGSEPWFIQLSFNAAHTPFHVPPDDLTTIKATEASSPALKHRAAVEAMDAEIRRLIMNIPVDVLANTWIIFVADNGTPGPAISDPAQRNKGKGTLFEGGIRVPLIVVGPGVVDPGREVQALVNTTDLFATILEMAGVPASPADRPDESVSLMPYQQATAAPALRRWVYSELFLPNGFGPYTERRRMVRDGRYKLVEILKGGDRHRAMFDLLVDPNESVDLLGHGIPAATDFETFYALLEIMTQQGAKPQDDEVTPPPPGTRSEQL
jgi:arylsulfatase B